MIPLLWSDRSANAAAGSQRPSIYSRKSHQSSLARVAFFLLVCGICGPAFGQASATATTVAITLQGSPVTSVDAGSVITLTASVLSGTARVTTGRVNFCDATARHCTDIHLIGTAQLTGAGTATVKFRPGIGSHSYKAVFAGTNTYAGSPSGTSALTVTGSVGVLATSTSIAKAGSWGKYELTGTVTETGGLAALTGTVSFVDTSYANAVLGTGTLGVSTPGLAWINSQRSTVHQGADSIASSDFNGDGIPDLAVVNGQTDTVSVLLGNGNGTFAAAASLGTGASPYGVVVADFNGDGNQDLAVVNTGNNAVVGFGVNYDTVSIFLGHGDGTFTIPAVSPATGSFPNAIATGDFNNDGVPDLAVANVGEFSESNDIFESSVTLLLGNGDGTFTQTAVSPAGGNYPFAIASGDFNGDGHADLAICSSGTTIDILLGNGDGTFVAASSPIVATYGVSIAVADLNGDGILDLAIGNGTSLEAGPTTVAILLGNGDGTFTASANDPVVYGNPSAIAIGDFNEDGKPDLAVTGGYLSGITVLLSKGDGTFTPDILSPALSSSPERVAVGDFNGDGRADMAAASINDGSVTVLLTEPTEIATTPPIPLTPTQVGTHLVDTSYDGDSNYVGSISGTTMLWGQPPSSTTVLAITSGGKPVTAVASGTAVTLNASVKVGTDSLAIGQVNFCDASANDCADIHLIGSSSLATSGNASFKFIPGPGSHSYKAVFLENASGVASSSPVSNLSVSAPPHVASSTTTTIALSGNIGDYALTATVTGTGSDSPLTRVVSFLDTSYSNGVLATAALGASTPGLAWLETSSTPYTDIELPTTASGDFNGDGIPDIAAISTNTDITATNSNTMAVTILLGNGDGTFKTTPGPSFAGYTTGIVAGDFNGDGTLDLAVSWFTTTPNSFALASTVTILLGNGDGTFTAAPTATAVGNSPVVFAAADFNGDGKLDLLLNDSYGGTGTAILLGNGDATFSPIQAIGGLPPTIAVADLNGDGIPDLVVGGPVDDKTENAEVFLGVGDGTFQSTGSVLPVSWPGPAVVADFNGDGIPDLAVSGAFYSPVSVLLGKGDGTFKLASGATNPSVNEPGAIAVADFNHDGKPDLAITNWNSYSGDPENPDITVLLGNGDGTFTTIPGDTQYSGTWSLIAADFNGDGLPDLAVGTSSGLSVLLTEPSQTATAAVTGVNPTGPGPHLVDATYPGDGNYNSSTSATTPLYVQAATPVISPGSATNSFVTTITISDTTPTASIYYEAFGPVQTNGFVQYTGPITLLTTGYETIYAYATASGYQDSQSVTVTYTPSTYIATITPSYGAPSALITITGTGFGATQGSSLVGIGNPNGAAAQRGGYAQVISWSETSITIRVPTAAVTGTIYIRNGGEVVPGPAFTDYPLPNITSVNAASGGTITIQGANLLDGGNHAQLTLNGVPATILSTTTATSLQAIIPPGIAGVVELRLTVNGVTLLASSTIPVPQITALSRNYGAPSAVVTITGQNFGAVQGGGNVVVGKTATFSGVRSEIVSWADTSITIRIPSGAPAGGLFVTNGPQASNTAGFTWYPEPGLIGSDRVTADQIALFGYNLIDAEGNGSVTINGLPAAIVSQSPGKLVVTPPQGVTNGLIRVTVNGVTVTDPANHNAP